MFFWTGTKSKVHIPTPATSSIVDLEGIHGITDLGKQWDVQVVPEKQQLENLGNSFSSVLHISA